VLQGDGVNRGRSLSEEGMKGPGLRCWTERGVKVVVLPIKEIEHRTPRGKMSWGEVRIRIRCETRSGM